MIDALEAASSRLVHAVCQGSQQFALDRSLQRPGA
jgi:hypothetical protein